MRGGLLAQAPACPFGHGPLTEISGWWALTGVNINPNNALAAMAPQPLRIDANGQAFSVRAWRCATCGNVQLFDV